MGKEKRYSVDSHIRIDVALLNCPAYIALDFSSQALYVDLRSKLRSTNNGDINAALSELKHRGWRSPTTLAKALRELIAVGLIAKTRNTIGVENGSTLCCLYRFTDHPVIARSDKHIARESATHDYRKVTSLAQAKALIRQAHAQARKRKSKASPSPTPEKTALQNLCLDATDSGVRRHSLGIPAVFVDTDYGASRIPTRRQKVVRNQPLTH